jgi:chemotaxis protein MotA
MKRIIRLGISILLTVIWMGALVTLASSDSPSRMLVMLGGTLPEGLIQGFTYLLFFFGMLEIGHIHSVITHENDAFSAHLLPEKPNWLLSPEDTNQLKLEMQHLGQSQKFLLGDLIEKACTKYRLSKSSSEVLELIEAQVRIYNADLESEQAFIRYVAWAIPSVGFIGTVLGIAASLGYANEASTPEGINKVTSMLAVAFDTTLVALFLSIILMFCIHYIQKRQDELFAHMDSYLIENLINRFYKQ